ncbi:MAG: hypothetical protein AB2421_08300 [Thermotaleaceae bacterium]
MSQFNVGISEVAEQRFKQIHSTLQNRYKQVFSEGEVLESMISMLHDSLERSYIDMDRDEDIKKQINIMEKMILGEKGVGILAALGITPSKVQRSLDSETEDEESKNSRFQGSDKNVLL